MAARLTREDRLDRMVAKMRQRVDAAPTTTRLLRHMPKSKLGVLVRGAGYERTSTKLLEELSGCDSLTWPRVDGLKWLHLCGRGCAVVTV